MATTIVISCPECDKQIKAPAELEGKKIRCKGCGHTFVVRASAAAGDGDGPAAKPAKKKPAPPPAKAKAPAKGKQPAAAAAGPPETPSALPPAAESLLQYLTRPPELAGADEEQLLGWCVGIVDLARRNGYLASTADSIMNCSKM